MTQRPRVSIWVVLQFVTICLAACSPEPPAEDLAAHDQKAQSAEATAGPDSKAQENNAQPGPQVPAGGAKDEETNAPAKAAGEVSSDTGSNAGSKAGSKTGSGAGSETGPDGEFAAQPLPAIEPFRLAAHIQVLASDDFEGRAPASPGEEKTIAYLVSQFQELGLEPGLGGEWTQAVPLVEITASPDTMLKIDSDAGSLEFAYGAEMMAWTKRVVESAAIESSELVFVGYGIVAPEYDWDDYVGVDMSGKTAVILVNDPGYATREPAFFRGLEMTYYGRWSYKFEEAARQGAAGAIIVHESDAAGYPWEVVSGSWSGPQFDLVSEDGNAARSAVEAWISKEAAERLFAAAGWDFESAKRNALSRLSHAPRPLGVRATIAVQNQLRKTMSHNVVAKLPGSTRPEQAIIYMGHWDHLGRDTALEGDQIYNGAKDNASGIAALLELARAFGEMDPGPERSIFFLAVTAEESGLLGSRWYAEHPALPLRDTVAAINIDGLNVVGPTNDVSVIGYGSSELERYLREAAAARQRVIMQESTPEKGFFFRSDQFNLARKGVPVLYTKEGVDYVGRGKDWGRARDRDWISNRYHKPADEYDPAWDLTGAAQDVGLLLAVGWRLANETSFPSWYEGSEFRAAREAMGR